MKKLALFVVFLVAVSFVAAAPKGWVERRVSTADPVRWDPSIRTSVFKDSDGLYHVIWEYYRNYPIEFDLLHASIRPTISVTELTPQHVKSQTDPQVAVMSGFFYVVYADNRNRHSQIVLQKVRNDGTTMLRDPQIISSNNPEVSGAQSPSVALDGNNNLYIVWSDSRNGNGDIYFSKLDPSGTPYPNLNNKRLTTSPSNSYDPSLTLNSDNTFNIVWKDNRDGNPELYIAKFTINGDPMTPERRITSGSYLFYWDPVTDLGPDGMVYVAWGEVFVPPGYPLPLGSYGIFIEKVNPSTGEVVIPRTMISAPLPDMPISVPSLVVDRDGYVHVSFTQGDSLQRNTLFYRKYRATVRPYPFVLVAGVSLTSDNAISDFPSMVFDGQDVHLAFVNNRNDIDGEIFYIRSQALVEFENLRAGQQGLMRLTNTLWPMTFYQTGLALGDTPGFLLPDGRRVPLNPDVLFFLTATPNPVFLQFSSGQSNERGELEIPIAVPEEARGVRIFGAFVAYSDRVHSISNAYSGVIS